MTHSIRAADAAAAARLVGSQWTKLKGARVLLTGATGFLGGALVEAILHANQQFGLKARIVALSRNPGAARLRQPWLGDEAVTLIKGDIASFEEPTGGFSHFIHAAAVAGVPLDSQDGGELSHTILQGTRHCLEVASRSGAKEFLFVSSGAIYGSQPPELSSLSEDAIQAPLGDSRQNLYARAKRAAEGLCLDAPTGLTPRIARCFSFIGPGIPLDAHYAAGNFIRDAVAGGAVHVEGDGTPVRSYLYSADAAAWLWTILISGARGGIYNVGGPEGVTILDLAREVALCGGNLKVELKGRPSGASALRYVPSVSRAERELGLRPSVTLREAVRRTLAWARADENKGRAA